MARWTQQSVEKKLRQSAGFDSFLSLTRGYLPLRVGRIEVLIFREEIGVSYYYRYPICSIEDAQQVNDFMFYAFPFLNRELENTKSKSLVL